MLLQKSRGKTNPVVTINHLIRGGSRAARDRGPIHKIVDVAAIKAVTVIIITNGDLIGPAARIVTARGARPVCRDASVIGGIVATNAKTSHRTWSRCIAAITAAATDTRIKTTIGGGALAHRILTAHHQNEQCEKKAFFHTIRIGSF